ncbi:M20 family metallopeptidase [Corynebacterium lowii]|uniref:Peptidase M20 domain-containing protein 2 n=1 Tax=Corynebacterium lowii TaxID=1544413 RepID=A0A0N8W0M4_9CORY|nr:M20 family metallopeptidase [Corynebacterium lowii]KQB87106.1 p-aminobenzoyl-glutamate hydrolase subunit B [Corynebacterium lowii]MDP9852308.1 amidohydrolase [Corynebacterium lowii]
MLPQPSTAYLDAMREGIERRARAAKAARARIRGRGAEEDYEGQERVWRDLTALGEDLRGDLHNLAFDLHDHPEEAFQEHYAVAIIAQLLRDHGHEVEVGVGGLETALRAEAVSPDFDPQRDPTVAILAEYDALPGIGHGCGHNIIAASAVGAFLAAAQRMEGARGRIVLLGTPAEEGHSGKEYMIRAGAFEGIDAAIMVHPFSFDLAEHAWVGRRTLTATFHGVSAHASSEPFMGRNALDAATLAYQGFGLLRQQMPPSDRLHAVITEGGQRPSVIPDTATMSIYVRSLMAQTLKDLSQRIDAVLDGAALMAGVEVSKEWDVHPTSLPVRNNHVLALRWADTQERRGRRALPGGVVPDTLAASTDFGNVSNLVPGLHPMLKIAPQGVALHTKAFAEYARTEEAVDAAVDAAVGLAQVAHDALREPALLHAAKEEFEGAGGVVRVE